MPTEELASCKDHTVDCVLGFAVPTGRTSLQRPGASVRHWEQEIVGPLGRGGLVFPVSAGDPLTAVDSGG